MRQVLLGIYAEKQSLAVDKELAKLENTRLLRLDQSIQDDLEKRIMAR